MGEPAGPPGEVEPSSVVYLDTETIVQIHHRVAPESGGVRELDRIDGAVGRPQTEFGGVSKYPTVLDKVAALLHGLASTQGFVDGNKRTAWMAAQVMLRANGYALGEIHDSEAEAIVLGVSVRAVSVELLTEWLESHLLTRPGQPVPRIRIEGVQIVLSDLVRFGPIGSIDFVRCVLIGPGLIYLGEVIELSECEFTNKPDTKIEAIFWDIDETVKTQIVGAIEMYSVSFRQCLFNSLAFAGTSEQITAFAMGVTIQAPY